MDSSREPTIDWHPMDETTPPTDWAAFWASVADFYEKFGQPITILAILLGAVVVRALLLYAIRRTVSQVVSGAKKSQNVEHTQELTSSPLIAARVVQRSRTLGSVLGNIVTIAVMGTAIVMILDNLGVQVVAIIGAAGVIAAGLAFGAQNIVKDILNGLFMVFEDQLGVGDIVDLGEASGTVESVGIRITQVRSVDGTLWFVRNGEILRVGNMTQGWARVIIDLPAPYTSDVAAMQDLMLKTAMTMATSAQWRRKVLEKPEIWGIESISAEAIVIRLVIKARPAEQWAVARELRLRLKLALDEVNVDLPALNRMVIDNAEITGVRRKSAPEPASDGADHSPHTGSTEPTQVPGSIRPGRVNDSRPS